MEPGPLLEAGPPVTPTFVQFQTAQTVGGRGWLGRFGGGCDYQVSPIFGGSLVVGVLADYDAKNLTGLWSDAAGFAGSETERDSWVVGPRIGFAVTPATLAYVDGGYTQARFDPVGLITGAVPIIPLPFTMVATTYDGWFLGGGAETALSSWLSSLPSGLFLKSEYRYSSYNSKDVPIIFNPTGALTGAYEHNTNYEQTITTSLVYKFNWMTH